MSQLAHGRGVLGTDHRPHEVLVAMFVGTSMPVWILVLGSWSGLRPSEPEPDRQALLDIPIHVTPLADMASPFIPAGAKVKAPSGWDAPQPAAPHKAVVSTKDNGNTEPADPDLEVYDGGTPPDDSDAAAEGDASTEPASDEDAGEGEADAGGTALGEDGGTREADARERRAAGIYAGNIQRFLRAGFGCPKRLEGAPAWCSPSASVTASSDGTITGVSFSGCGMPEIDSAAKASIESKKGQQLPPPPEEYPQFQRSSFSVSYTCK